jgi:hypothetical protein
MEKRPGSTTYDQFIYQLEPKAGLCVNSRGTDADQTKHTRWSAQIFARSHRAHRHSAPLIALIIAFAVRPLIGDTAPSAAVFSVALVLVLLVALYNINVDELVGERGGLLIQARRRLRLGWVLAATVALERVGSIQYMARCSI